MRQPPTIKDPQMQLIINMLKVQDGGYFDRFVGMLREWLNEHRIYGDTAEDRDMVLNQGAIQFLDHLIKEIDGNRERYNKMQAQR